MRIVLTIGEVARLADTTVKAVRHYHAHGLLPEPERDAAGYRRYGSAELVRLLRIRRLRELGLSVPRIRELLGDGPDTVRAALAELDRELAAKQRDITKQRKRIAELRASTVDLELPEPVAGLFTELARPEAGLAEELVEREKNAILLLNALAPEHTGSVAAFAELIWREHRALSQRIARRFQELADAPEDAPGVAELAEDLISLARQGDWAAMLGQDADRRGAALMQDYLDDFSPAQRQAITLMTRLLASPAPPPG